ncbi:MAG: tetratricopeptide repeat protein [Deltaproteobacteria bacterium]|nr:tetratricopeptide repeat protein [Deltaproteobacteria bacterium]
MDSAIVELTHLGREAFNDGRYEEAERYLRKLLDLDCRFADIFNMLGAIAFQKGDREGAVALFQEALDINPHYTEALLNLAVALNDLGRYEEAERAFEKARRASRVDQGTVDPYVKGRLANVHADIGEIYHSLGMLAEAESEYRKALALGPTFPDLRTRVGVLFRDMGRYDDAVAEFRRVKEEHPHYTEAGIQLGITYYSRGQVDLAVEEWNGVLERSPDNPKALMYLRLAEREQV